MTPLSCCPTPEPRAYMNSQVHSRKRRWHKRRGQNQEFVPAEFVRRLHWGKRLARRDIKTLVIKSCAYEKGLKKSGVLSMHRQTTEEWGQRTEGARVNVGGWGGGRRGEGMRCLHKANVCKIVAEMKAGSSVDCFLISEFDRSSERAVKSPNFTHKRRFLTRAQKRLSLG